MSISVFVWKAGLALKVTRLGASDLEFEEEIRRV